MSRRRWWYPLVLGAAILPWAGCGDQAAAPVDGGQDGAAPQDGTWVLADGMVDGRRLVAPAGTRISLVVEGDRAGGTAACNGYGATIERDDAAIRIGVTSRTEMACGPEAMDAEERFLAALGRIASAVAEGDRLELRGPSLRLLFDLEPPVRAADLVEVDWRLDTLLVGDTATSAAGGGSIVLRGDGTMTGGTGCRSLSGRWRTFGDEVTFTDLAAEGDVDACSSTLREQDRHVVAVLEGGFRAVVDGRRLTMAGDGGRSLVFTAP